MEIKELKSKSKAELNKLLEQSRQQLRETRFKDAAKQLKNVRALRVIKKDIAKILTLINTHYVQ